jgi:TetR/AcrR family transcriptional repressor of mexJK operon
MSSGSDQAGAGGKGTSPGGDRESSSARKRRAIMGAAVEEFLRKGYLGTSVDEIAAKAHVSKTTVYKHFRDKERLFAEIVEDTIETVGSAFFARVDALGDVDTVEDVEAELHVLARHLAGLAADERLMSLRRLITGEVYRFPELGRAYFDASSGRTVRTLAPHLQRLADRGMLALEDAQVAAENFNWLPLAIPLNRAVFDTGLAFTEAELDRYAEEAVRLFLSAYGTQR